MDLIRESQILELKTIVPSKDVLYKNIYAFANTDGGAIVLGFDEVKQEKKGLSLEDCNCVKEMVKPLEKEIPFVISEEKIQDNRYLLTITVEKTKKNNYLNGKLFIREGDIVKESDVDNSKDDPTNRSNSKEKDEDLIEQLIYIDTLTTKDTYVRCLDKIIKENENVCNIGVIGPYGSGKSSVVHSYINLDEKRKKETLYFSQETIRKHLEPSSVEDKSEQKTTVKNPNIKSIIYLELLRSDKDAIDYKKYLYRIVTSKMFKVFGSIFAIGFSLLLGFITFALLKPHLELWVTIVVCSLLSVTLCSLFYTYDTHKLKIINKYGEIEFIKKVNDIEEIVEKNPASIDNLVLTILKRRKVSFIVIEDMERLNERYVLENGENLVIEVIECFKILSDLLNRSNVFGSKKHIKFIYGLNDDCFASTEQRSKYFDAIIPVIPITTSTGAVTFISNHKVIKGKPLTSNIIRDISLFFENQRQINAFITQFYFATSYIKLELYDELFALTAFNVLFPKEYHTLYKDSSWFKDFLLDKKNLQYR